MNSVALIIISIQNLYLSRFPPGITALQLVPDMSASASGKVAVGGLSPTVHVRCEQLRFHAFSRIISSF